MTKQKPSHRKALRSAAAKKGWETRRENAEQSFRMVPDVRTIPPYVRFEPPTWIVDTAPPDQIPATPNWLHRLWSKLVGR